MPLRWIVLHNTKDWPCLLVRCFWRTIPNLRVAYAYETRIAVALAQPWNRDIENEVVLVKTIVGIDPTNKLL